MKHYTDTISVPLAEKLEEKGMPYIDIDCDTFDEGTQYQRDEVWCNNTYAEVFDWLMNMGIYIRIEPFVATAFVAKSWGWSYHIDRLREPSLDTKLGFGDWHEAAEKAIEKALDLIK